MHVDVTRRELAEFVRGKGQPTKGSGALAQLDQVLDRSQLMPFASGVPKTFDIKGKETYNDDLEH
jgi:hypothetical protein